MHAVQKMSVHPPRTLSAILTHSGRPATEARAASTLPTVNSPWILAAAGLLLGNNLLPYLVLALGGALLVGNGLALIRPPARPNADDLRRAPPARTVAMMAVGALASVWALASLLRG
jgi:hypothetical protein